MKIKRLTGKQRTSSDWSSLEAFLADAVCTPGRKDQSTEQMQLYAAHSQAAMRERLPELIADSSALTPDIAASSAAAPEKSSAPVRRFRRPSYLRRMMPAAAAALFLVASTAMPASGNFRINLSSRLDNNWLYVYPEDSDNQSVSTANRIFKEVSEQLACPQLSLQPYASSVICTQKSIYPDTKYAILSLSVNDTMFHFEFKTVDDNYSQAVSDTLEEVEKIAIDDDDSFVIYHDLLADAEQAYICYLLHDNNMISVSGATDYSIFAEFIRHLDVAF